jgi:hypothetical protein
MAGFVRRAKDAADPGVIIEPISEQIGHKIALFESIAQAMAELCGEYTMERPASDFPGRNAQNSARCRERRTRFSTVQWPE